MATLQGGVAYFIMPDHLGAPHEIVNAANARVWFWDHDPFGNGTPTAAAGFSHDLRFPGQIYDAETRLHNNGFRDYSPALGRYVQSDPLGLEGGINTYAYAKNNPLSAVDPTGTLVTPETYVWDIPNVVMGLVSFVDNLFHGNYAAAGVDFAGLGVDVTAAVLPGVPAGAAATIRAGRGAASAEAAAIKLYRAVGPAELKDIQATGAFRNLGSAEGKYFTTSAEEASSYAKQAVGAFGDPPYTLVQTTVSPSVLGGLSSAIVDRGISAWVIPSERLSGLAPIVMNHMRIPGVP